MDSKLAEPRVTLRGTASAADAPTSDVCVRQVATRRERQQFVELPWRIYASDPAWVPPLLIERKDFINANRHPFYLHGAATQFLAFRAGEPVGRILVSDDPNYNREHHENLGCFGMFESIDDERVASALLDAAAAWLSGRGRGAMRGPIDYSMNYNCGLLIDGFSTPPRILMNHNPPYYARLLEAWGLAKVKDLYAWWFDDSYRMLEVWRRRVERLSARGRIKIRPLSFKHLNAEIQRCKIVYNGAWESSWGFVKMTDAEFDHLAKHLRMIAVAGLLLLAEVDDQPIGFAMTLPDLNEAIRPLNGRLFSWGLPTGLLKLRRNQKRIRSARFLVLGILPAFRRRGVAELLIARTLEYGKHVAGLTDAELSWTLEDNSAINHTIEAVGGRRYKTYRLYERTI
jgi:GNAT superfamily N-acetyltransferase